MLSISGAGYADGSGLTVTIDNKTKGVDVTLTSGSSDVITFEGNTKVAPTIKIDATAESESLFESSDSITSKEGSFTLSAGKATLTATKGALIQSGTAATFTGSDDAASTISGQLSTLGAGTTDGLTVASGSATLDLDEGAKTFTTLSLNTASDAKNVVNVKASNDDALTLTLGSGSDTVNVDAGVTFRGDPVPLDLGDGKNTLTANGTLAGFTSITAGSGDDSISVGASGDLGIVATVALGDGANSFSIASGGKASLTAVTGGSGNDTINLSGLTSGTVTHVTVTGGGGKDTITLSDDKNITYTIDLTAGSASGSSINGVKTGTVIKAETGSWTTKVETADKVTAKGMYSFTDGTLTWYSDSGAQSVTLDATKAFFSGSDENLTITTPSETDLLVLNNSSLSMAKDSSDDITVTLKDANPFVAVDATDATILTMGAPAAVETIDTTGLTGTMTITGLANGGSALDIAQGKGSKISLDTTGQKGAITIIDGSTESTDVHGGIGANGITGTFSYASESGGTAIALTNGTLTASGDNITFTSTGEPRTSAISGNLAAFGVDNIAKFTVTEGSDATTASTVTMTGAFSALTEVVLGDGDDNLSFVGTESKADKLIVINAGKGDDTIDLSAGTFADGLVINGGAGKDNITLGTHANKVVTIDMTTAGDTGDTITNLAVGDKIRIAGSGTYIKVDDSESLTEGQYTVTASDKGAVLTWVFEEQTGPQSVTLVGIGTNLIADNTTDGTITLGPTN